MAVTKIEHVGVMVKNLEASIRFYESVIGLTLKGTLPHPDEKIKLAFLGFAQSGETELELIEGYNDALPEEGKVHHLAFTVDNVEAELERIRGLGIPLIDEAPVTLPNGSKYFFFHGPDGEWIEFFQSTRS